MTPRHGGLIAGALAAILLAAAPGVALAANEEFRLEAANGSALTPADLDRGTTLLVVWASWSPRCRDLPERLAALATSWDARARLLTVNFQESPEQATLMLAQFQAPTFFDRDGVFAKRHAVATLPGLVVYRDGEVLYQGRMPDDADALLRELLP